MPLSDLGPRYPLVAYTSKSLGCICYKKIFPVFNCIISVSVSTMSDLKGSSTNRLYSTIFHLGLVENIEFIRSVERNLRKNIAKVIQVMAEQTYEVENRPKITLVTSRTCYQTPGAFSQTSNVTYNLDRLRICLEYNHFKRSAFRKYRRLGGSLTQLFSFDSKKWHRFRASRIAPAAIRLIQRYPNFGNSLKRRMTVPKSRRRLNLRIHYVLKGSRGKLLRRVKLPQKNRQSAIQFCCCKSHESTNFDRLETALQISPPAKAMIKALRRLNCPIRMLLEHELQTCCRPV